MRCLQKKLDDVLRENASLKEQLDAATAWRLSADLGPLTQATSKRDDEERECCDEGSNMDKSLDVHVDSGFH